MGTRGVEAVASQGVSNGASEPKRRGSMAALGAAIASVRPSGDSGHEPESVADSRRLAPARRPELREDVCHVDRHGPDADEQLVSDLAVRPAEREPLEDLVLAGG